MTYRVLHGETMPAWHKDFETEGEAEAFVKRCHSIGDTVFAVDDSRLVAAGLSTLSAPEPALISAADAFLHAYGQLQLSSDRRKPYRVDWQKLDADLHALFGGRTYSTIMADRANAGRPA